MVRRCERCLFVPLAALAAAAALSGSTGCGQSPRDRHFLSRGMVHRPVPADAALTAAPTPSPSIATVPTDPP